MDDRTRAIALKALALGTLLLVCYWPMMSRTLELLSGSDDVAQAFFAPPVALFIVWHNRDGIRSTLGRPTIMGLFVVILAALVAIAATLGGSTTILRFAFLFSLAGSSLALGGASLLRHVLFPISLLLFTFPLPAVLYGELTQPFQLLASRLAEQTFELLGYGVLREGNLLQLAHMRLSIVEACSGIRSLTALAFFSLSYVYFFDQRNWARLLVLAASVPAAVLLNALRIVATGILSKFNQGWAHGTLHDILGWTGFAVGFCIVLAFHRLLLVNRKLPHT